MHNLTLVISGEICSDKSLNLKKFWQGFINIQNSLYDVKDLRIVGHSLNPEYDELVKKVYKNITLQSEKKIDFSSKEYISSIISIDKFENGLERYKSEGKIALLQSAISNSQSLSKAMSSLNNLGIEEDTTVLVVKWDQGFTENSEVNFINYDSSLPIEYLYMPYHSEVDEGYSDAWFFAPYKIARKFELYGKYVLDSIAGNNDFFENFTKNGWPLALIRNNNRVSIYRNRIFKKIIVNVNFEILRKYLPFFAKRINGLEHRAKVINDKPYITGENSLLLTSKTNIKFKVNDINVNAILKSFILDNNLRDKTRFLGIKDFENIEKGHMINQISFAYVIYSHSTLSDCWEMAVGQAMEYLPSNCGKIFLMSDDSYETYKKFSNMNLKNVELLTYDDNKEFISQLINKFKKINEDFEYIYFVRENMPLTSKVDKIYLNTLLHYLNNSNEFYIQLIDANLKDIRDEDNLFPGLVKTQGIDLFQVNPSLIKVNNFLSFLQKNKNEIEILLSKFIFLSAKGSEIFSHCSPILLEGKWATNKWSEEISFLAKKYGINLAIRGEVK